MNQQTWTLIGIPIDCSGRSEGVERMPAALRMAGLVEAIEAVDLGDLPVAITSPERDPLTGIIDFPAVCATSETIYTAVRDSLAQGERPFLLGGCCTLLIGVAAALKTHFGHCGLAFVDGHLDFYDGKSSPTGETSDMELAIITGLGPNGLVDLVGAPPLLNPADIVVLGYRDAEQAAQEDSPDPAVIVPQMPLYDAQTVKANPAQLGRQITAQLEQQIGRFWLHFDLDVLDETILPTVDYPMPGGLNWEEAAALIRPFLASPVLVGMDITIYNPTLDPTGEYGERITQFFKDVMHET